MSAITTTYDNLIALIQTALPSHKRLLNVYDPDQNPESSLSQGYGVIVGAGSLNDTVSFTLGVARSFSFIVTRKVYASDSDSAKRANSEKNIVEDQVLVLKALKEDFNLGGTVLKAEYQGDKGIEYMTTEKGQHLKLETELHVEYLEQLT